MGLGKKLEEGISDEVEKVDKALKLILGLMIFNTIVSLIILLKK